MAVPKALSTLARILSLRQQSSNPYNLLLTSTISLTPKVLSEISDSDDWYKFGEYMRSLGHNDKIDHLSHYLGPYNNLNGYRALAHLITEGYFSTILTTNLDSTLERALSSHTQYISYQTLIVGKDKDEYIVRALERRSNDIYIVKL